MAAVLISTMRAELRLFYLPPIGATATWRKIRQVLEEFERSAGCRKVTDLTDLAIATWISAYPHRRPATTRSLLSALRRACSYAVSKGWMTKSPFTFRSLDRWLGHEDVESSIGPCRHLSMQDLSCLMTFLFQESKIDWEAHRLYALAMTAALTGARALEIQAAKVTDFDLKTKTLTIRPNERRRLKTRKSRRIVVLPDQLVQILDRWLPTADSIWAFPGIRRQGPWIHGSGGGKPLQRLQDAARRCGVKGVTFHAFRHSYVTHSGSINWHVPESLTRQLCGHTTMRTTELYRGFDLANAVRAAAGISVPISAV